MSDSNDNVILSPEKSINLVATSLLLIWIVIIFLGFIFIIGSFLFNNSFIVIFYENPIFIIAFIIMFFSSRAISHSIIDLLKNKRWKESSKFVRGIFVQLGTATIVAIITIFIYGANYFTNSIFMDFFFLFTILAFDFSIIFFSFSLYYYRFDVPPRENGSKFQNF